MSWYGPSFQKIFICNFRLFIDKLLEDVIMRIRTEVLIPLNYISELL
jgi:hypothetical protein